MAGVQESRLEAVIDRFYEAAGQPLIWRPVLQELAEALGAEGVELYPGPKAGFSIVQSPSLDEVTAAGLAEGWFLDNPRIARGMPLLRTTPVITDTMVFGEGELDRLAFQTGYLGRFRLRSFAATALTHGQAGVLISIERRIDQGTFSLDEVRVIGRMIPHLRRAAQLASRVADAHARGMLDGMEALSCGGILLDAQGRISALNSRAEGHVGRGLIVAKAHLSAAHKESDAALQHLIGSVVQRRGGASHGAFGPIALQRPSRQPLVVHGSPLVRSARDPFAHSSAMLLIVDPDDHPEPNVPLLRHALGLSPAEARLAAEIGKGRDIGEIAIRHGLSEGTIRSQLKSVFGKTGTHRQGELVALVGRLISPGLRR